MPKRPEPKRALITGGSSGMGAALSRRLAARGLEVWLAARRLEQLNAQVELIRGAGGRAHAVTLDVSNPDATHDTLVRLDDEVGGFDLVVANAGIGGARAAQLLATTSWADMRDILQVNLLGAAATIAPFIPRMVARGHGHLVGVSSLAADVPSIRGAPYGASKAGLTFLLECADLELRARGVDVTIIHPGFVSTPMISDLPDKLPFVLTEEQAARIIDRGIQRRARIVRFPWILATLARFGNALPRAVLAPLIRRAMAPPVSDISLSVDKSRPGS